MAKRNLSIKIKERGPVPRTMRKVYTKARKEGWTSTGKLFHEEMRDKRFTKEHARTARYRKRSGEEFESNKESKAFRQSYTGQKYRKFGHTRPLEYTGETRRLVRTANISSTSKGGRVKYPGARKLNFRNPHSSIQMSKEFRKLTGAEKRTLAKQYDKVIDREMNADKTTTERSL